VIVGQSPVVDPLGLVDQMSALGIEALSTTSRDAFFAADIGITGVAYLIAETGSVIVTTSPETPRSHSLLPPVHIAIATRAQILADLFDLFNALPSPPACLTVITGPSKTGDIELRLVTGVHGPGEVHVIIIE
jgi:L-lactate dehydrogenase complex protein LldG